MSAPPQRIGRAIEVGKIARACGLTSSDDP